MSTTTPLDLAAQPAPLVPTLPVAVATKATVAKPTLSRQPSRSGKLGAGAPAPPTTCQPPSVLDALFPGPSADAGADTRGSGAQIVGGLASDGKMLLELTDGSAYEGFSFGADHSITGECVFQTGTSVSRPGRGCRADCFLRRQAWSATQSR